MTHKHAVGNLAWGIYMRSAGYTLQTALRGAAAQGATTAGGEDSLDQQMIRGAFWYP
ncbi:MAG: hypothetical protein IPJ78_19085 [Gemmatimonadetes bacterium]|nr:hypothetical protein [Gemmatimonadota bacterium]